MKARLLLLWLVFTVVICLPRPAWADSVYAEGDTGDLSGDRTAPTALTLSLGRNQLTATSVQGDLEYVALTLPPGGQLDAVVVAAFASTDSIAFAGIQAGTQFTEPNTGTNVGNLLGYSHFGPGAGNVGTDILDEMGTGAGAIGFTGSLTGSVYTLWLQQAGTAVTTYTLDLFVGPTVSVTTHDEATDGDLAGDATAPTALSLVTGGNRISATSVRGDREYFRVAVPLGQQLTAILLTDYTSADDDVAFVALQRGTTFTEPPQGTQVGNLLGYTHMGPAIEPVGADLLDNLGAAAGALGFSRPLYSGDYSFWMQQTGVTTTTYTVELVVAPVPTQTLYSEASTGDLADDRTVPTVLTATVGGNLVSAVSMQGDREYFRVIVPAGHALEALFLTSYAGADGTAFIGVQEGDSFTEPPSGTNVSQLLGYSHFGPNVEAVGNNILDNIGAGSGALGFSGSLPSGSYTFWTQQVGASPTTYALNFVVVPAVAAPAAINVYLPLVAAE